MERTFVMIKPDGVKKGLVGEIIKRFEQKGLTLETLSFERLSEEKAKALYAVHKGKDFFEILVNHILSGPVVLMVLSGENAIEVVRKMIGATNPKEALPGTIRGDYALEITKNIIHGSDSQETAEYEISLFFSE